MTNPLIQLIYFQVTSSPQPVVPLPSTTIKPTPDHPYPIPSPGTEDILQMTIIVPQDEDVSQAAFKNDIRNRLEIVYLEGLSSGGGRRRKRSILEEVDFITQSKKHTVVLDKGLHDDTTDLLARSHHQSVLKYASNANWQSFLSGMWNLLMPFDRSNDDMRVHSRQRRQTVDPSNTTEVLVSVQMFLGCVDFLNKL